MWLRDFNTSNVTIQLCNKSINIFFSKISIHLMLLFNHLTFYFLDNKSIISIHLMLLFNHLTFYFLDNKSIISIHLMLLFNFAIKALISFLAKFQYISYFNTSNVTIQQTAAGGLKSADKFQYI